jgi:hypothetical protein
MLEAGVELPVCATILRHDLAMAEAELTELERQEAFRQSDPVSPDTKHTLLSQSCWLKERIRRLKALENLISDERALRLIHDLIRDAEKRISELGPNRSTC